MRTQYDPPTALTFLLAGIGVGALITLVFAPRAKAPVKVATLRNEERRRVPYNREIPQAR